MALVHAMNSDLAVRSPGCLRHSTNSFLVLAGGSIDEPDVPFLTQAVARRLHAKFACPAACASVKEVADYMAFVVVRAQAIQSTLVVSLIYLEKLLSENVDLALTEVNWRPLVSIGLLLASKVEDDLSMVNSDFSIILNFALDKLNDWERHFLSGIKYDVSIKASHYARVYFELRAESLARTMRGASDVHASVVSPPPPPPPPRPLRSHPHPLLSSSSSSSSATTATTSSHELGPDLDQECKKKQRRSSSPPSTTMTSTSASSTSSTAFPSPQY